MEVGKIELYRDPPIDVRTPNNKRLDELIAINSEIRDGINKLVKLLEPKAKKVVDKR